MDLIPILQKSPLFKDWKSAELEQLAGLSIVKNLGPGEMLFYEGEPSTSLYLIAKGTISIKKNSTKGDEENVTKIGAGSLFGEMAMLNSEGLSEKRSASAEAAEISDVVEVSYDAIRKIIQASPQAGLSFYRNLAVTLSGRIRRTTEDLTGLRALRLRHT